MHDVRVRSVPSGRPVVQPRQRALPGPRVRRRLPPRRRPPRPQERLGLKAVAFLQQGHPHPRLSSASATRTPSSPFAGTDPVTLPNWLTVVVVRLVESMRIRRPRPPRLQLGPAAARGAQVETILDAARRQAAVPHRPLDGRGPGGLGRVPPGEGGPPAGRDLHVRRTARRRPGFCAGYGLPTYRVVNRLDLVPEMPLASVKRLLPAKPCGARTRRSSAELKRMAERVPCYGHVNSLVYIDRDGADHPRRPRRPVARRRRRPGRRHPRQEFPAKASPIT